ncbi:MAG: hypothetical protein V2J24_02825 [Pseudomonadales bacterium]|jgi:hypothetical protein|nr:hypothetical protein [Pseudomonadales bacterium]
MPRSVRHSTLLRPLTRLASIGAGLVLAGCTTLTAGGFLAAARLAPLSADPAEVSAAVSVPAGVGLRAGDAKLSMAYEPDTPGAEPFEEHFDLEIVLLPDFAQADPRDAVFGARIGADDHARFRLTQARIRRLRASGDSGPGTMSINVSSACFTGERPDALPVGTWLRTQADGAWIRLTRRRDLLALDENAIALRDELEPCTAAGA